MKDFDQEREERPRRAPEDRTFRLGGETFVARDRFRPDALAPMENLQEVKRDPTTCRCSHRLNEHPQGACTAVGCTCPMMRPVITDPGTPLDEQLAVLDRTIVAMLEPDDDAAARYAAVRAREDDPLEIEDLMSVIRWMTSEDTARPTGRPAVSTAGPETRGEPSTAASSSPDTPAA